MGSKFQAWVKTVSPPDFNIETAKDLSITSGLTCDASGDDYASLLGGSFLALEPVGENISLLGDNHFLSGGNIYPTGDEYFGASTTTGNTRSSEVKQST